MSENPRAFPSSATDDRYGGMSLRDWFAAQAAIVAISFATDHAKEVSPMRLAAAMAYDFADAMLAEREKRNA